MPLVASLITASQSKLARSAGVRATPALILARYDRMIRLNPAASGALPLIHGEFGSVPKMALSAVTGASARASQPRGLRLALLEAPSRRNPSRAGGRPPRAAQSQTHAPA